MLTAIRRRLMGALLVATATLLFSASLYASEIVRFNSAPIPPTPLKMRLAQARGEAATAEAGIDIIGELSQPDGKGPFPALVMLHGCGRPIPALDRIRVERYVSWGYAVLTFDSFKPRGIRQACSPGGGPAADRLMDAFGALDYLARLPSIDAGRIAVVGFSQGGGMALSAVNANEIGTLGLRQFKAAVAYYPTWCPSANETVTAPVLILVGELDDWTPAKDCRASMATRSGQEAREKLIVLPDAYHGFDGITLKDKPLRYFGHLLAYNASADHEAEVQMKAFLSEVLGQ